MKKSKWQITGWVHWGDPKYNDMSAISSNYDDVRDSVIDEIKSKNYKICGFSHQHNDKGVPVINNKYRFEVSLRCWGRIMADAYEHFGWMDYCDWAWVAPEKEVLPK